MLKRNLIAIAIVVLGLGISSVLGQAADWEIKPMVKKPKTTIKKPTATQRIRKPKKQFARDLDGQSAGTERRTKSQTSQGDQPELQRTNTRNAGQIIPKQNSDFFDTYEKGTDVKSRKANSNNTPRGKSKAKSPTRITHSDEFENVVKPKNSTRKPNRKGNLGDTFTHEIGH